LVRRRLIAAAVALVVIAAAVFCVFRWLRRVQPLPAYELTKIEVQLEAGNGVLTAHVSNGSDYRVRDIDVRVVALRPSASPGAATDGGGWQIGTSWCTFDPVAKPDEYDKVVDRVVRFGVKLEPTTASEARVASDFVPGSDYWECRIVSADGVR
jgi:hypothetical protein